MPDIDSRRTREKAFAGDIAKSLREQSKRVQAAGGASADWEEFKKELIEKIEKRLNSIFLLAALIFMTVETRVHGSETKAAGGAKINDNFTKEGGKFSAQTAKRVAQKMVDKSRERVQKVGQDVARLPTKEQPKALKTEIRATFSAPRAESVAVTLTTEAISAGEETARLRVQQGSGINRIPVWITSEDDRVCPVCRPLNLKEEPVWKGRYPNGPPAHPNCRCFKLFKLERQSA